MGARIAVAVAAWLVGLATAQGEGPIVLRDVTARTGIGFRHTDGSSGRRYIVEYVASGLATFDYDGDGLIDVYFLNGRPLPGTTADVPPRNHLYRNLGGFRFKDVTEEAGVGDEGFGLGVCIGDYDSDGHPDIYVNNFGPNVLYRNNGDGTFRDVTSRAGVGRGERVGAGASFLDVDHDGHLDLFVANYIKFSYDMHAPLTVAGLPAYRGPQQYPPDANNLFRNNGDGTFTDVSQASGITAHPGSGMGIVSADYDNDGSTDVFVLNDNARNFLFHNDGAGKFSEVGLASGAAYNLYGQETGNMGVDAGDYDHDGLLDFFVTTYHKELPVLFHNLGGGLFEDAALSAGSGQGTLRNVKWGCGFVDFDNDGYKDIFLGLGNLDDNIQLRDDTITYEDRPVLLRNLGNGRFANVSDSSGDGMQVKSVARGVAFDDLDNDGRIDVVILSSRRPPVILHNQSATGNHWLQIRLRGVKTNRDGVGARVKVVAGDLTQIDEVLSGRGYQSHFGSRLHLGLGKRDRVDRIEVRWIGGGTDVLENLPVDRLIAITEGTGHPTEERADEHVAL